MSTPQDLITQVHNSEEDIESKASRLSLRRSLFVVPHVLSRSCAVSASAAAIVHLAVSVLLLHMLRAKAGSGERWLHLLLRPLAIDSCLGGACSRLRRK
jgi:hypothetical protein